MPRPYVRLRETTFDLYVERDLLPGYYKAISVISSWFILAGYVLFAIIFTSRDDDLNATRTLVTAVGSGLLIIGYTGLVAMALICRSLLFLLDGIIIPTLTASIVGLFITIANFALHTKLPTAQIYWSVPLVTACVTTVVSALSLLVAYRELAKIRKRDERRRWHVQMGPYNSPSDPRAMNGIPGQDDEAQRRQLMRLLHDRQESLANIEDHNTFKIDLPGEPKYDSRRENPHIVRGPSPARKGFSIGNIVPWKKTQQNTFKDARERRREEIERSSVQSSLPQDSNQPPQASPWGWPPVTRYA